FVCFFFFFQAEDGIRDFHVTGVQTCALPISGLWQAKPEWTRAQLMERLLKSGSQANDPDTELGYGVPNFTSAYFWDDLEPGEVAKSYLFPNPLDGDELFIHHGKDTDCMVRI